MNFRDLVLQNRSTRRFDESHPIDAGTLRDFVDLARLTPSAANLQPLRYVLSHTPERNALIFQHLRWAGYLQDWSGPAPGQRPGAYILLFADSRISPNVDCDHGIAAQTILLAAAERGLAGCMLGSIDREALVQHLGLEPHYRLLLAVALGKSAETIVLEDTSNGNIRYYRDSDGVHHVPKRPLDKVILDI